MSHVGRGLNGGPANVEGYVPRAQWRELRHLVALGIKQFHGH
jgi:hypothetical protein